MTTQEYLLMLKENFGAKTVLVGYDNRMGCDADDADQVMQVAAQVGLEAIKTEMIPSEQGYAVSSTKIRQKVEEGDVQEASAMLGYEYSLLGVVVAGNRIGRTIGFPTANMQLYEPLKLVPGNGVYFVRVNTLGRDWYGMCNVGCRPTVELGNTRTIETHIFGFDEDIYGLDIKVTFLEKIRDEVKFASLDDLKNQLNLDMQTCLHAVESGVGHSK